MRPDVGSREEASSIINPMRKSAFTLIELLVVIAIIAILAAILFPVFAQAKLAAKKTVALSNVKQLGTSTQIYLADSDDTFPLGAVYNPFSGRVSCNRFVATPASIVGQIQTGAQATQGTSASGAFWSNSLQPYIKSLDMLDDSNAASTTSIYNLSFYGSPSLTYNGIADQKHNFAFNYNGLLNAYNATSAVAPSNLPLFSLDGNRKTPGAALTNPTLQCGDQPGFTAAPTCMYIPTKAGCAGEAGLSGVVHNGETSFYSTSTGGAGWSMYNSQWPVSFSDTHAKTFKLAAGTPGGSDNPKTGPFAFWPTTDPYGKLGTGGGMKRWWSTPDGVLTCHAYLFRPDVDVQTAPDQALGL